MFKVFSSKSTTPPSLPAEPVFQPRYHRAQEDQFLPSEEEGSCLSCLWGFITIPFTLVIQLVSKLLGFCSGKKGTTLEETRQMLKALEDGLSAKEKYQAALAGLPASLKNGLHRETMKQIQEGKLLREGVEATPIESLSALADEVLGDPDHATYTIAPIISQYLKQLS